MFYVWEGWKYNACLLNPVDLVQNEDIEGYAIRSFSLPRKIIYDINRWHGNTHDKLSSVRLKVNRKKL